MIKDCNQNNINTIKDPLKRKNEASNYLRNYIELLITLQQIILNLTEENLEISVEKTMNIFDLNFPYSFNLVISNLIYFSFYSKRNEINIYLQYVKIIQVKEEEISKDYPKILEIFIKYISDIKSQEAYYLIEQMIERNLIHENITKHISSKYFAQYKTEIENKNSEYIDPIERSFVNSYDELAQNDFELHKRYVQEGVNPNEIAKIIRNDNVEKLQEISSQTKFNFKQTIEPSLYERYSFINQEYIPLIDYAAFLDQLSVLGIYY